MHQDEARDTGPVRKGQRLILLTLLVYALLVGTHLGEFWPFSIYPMFSRGGHPWVRTVVQDVSAETAAVSWTTVSDGSLPGVIYPLGPTGINQNDLANFVSKSDRWDAPRVAAVRALFGSTLGERSLMVYRVEGRLSEDAQVGLSYEPFMLLAPDTTVFGPRIRGMK